MRNLLIVLFLTVIAFAGCEAAPVKTDGLTPEARKVLAEAWELHQQGKLDQARDLYLDLDREFPESPVVANNLGDVLLRKKDYVAAELHFLDAVKLDPENPVYHFNLGNLYMHLADDDPEFFKKAVEQYDRAEKLDPETAAYSYHLGLAQEKRGYKNIAVEAYQRALKADPCYEPVLRHLAQMRLEDMRYLEALGYYKSLLALHPKEAEIYFNLARCLFNLRQYEKSVLLLEEFLKNVPEATEQEKGVAEKYVKSIRKQLEHIKVLKKLEEGEYEEGSDVPAPAGEKLPVPPDEFDDLVDRYKINKEKEKKEKSPDSLEELIEKGKKKKDDEGE